MIGGVIGCVGGGGEVRNGQNRGRRDQNNKIELLSITCTTITAKIFRQGNLLPTTDFSNCFSLPLPREEFQKRMIFLQRLIWLKTLPITKKSLIERYLKERNISLHLRGRFNF